MVSVAEFPASTRANSRGSAPRPISSASSTPKARSRATRTTPGSAKTRTYSRWRRTAHSEQGRKGRGRAHAAHRNRRPGAGACGAALVSLPVRGPGVHTPMAIGIGDQGGGKTPRRQITPAGPLAKSRRPPSALTEADRRRNASSCGNAHRRQPHPAPSLGVGISAALATIMGLLNRPPADAAAIARGLRTP